MIESNEMGRHGVFKLISIFVLIVLLAYFLLMHNRGKQKLILKEKASNIVYVNRKLDEPGFIFRRLDDEQLIDLLISSINKDLSEGPESDKYEINASVNHVIGFYSNDSKLIQKVNILGDNYISMNGNRYKTTNTLSTIKKLESQKVMIVIDEQNAKKIPSYSDLLQ